MFWIMNQLLVLLHIGQMEEFFRCSMELECISFSSGSVSKPICFKIFVLFVLQAGNQQQKPLECVGYATAMVGIQHGRLLA